MLEWRHPEMGIRFDKVTQGTAQAPKGGHGLAGEGAIEEVLRARADASEHPAEDEPRGLGAFHACGFDDENCGRFVEEGGDECAGPDPWPFGLHEPCEVRC